jgi:hypothetical protein
VRCLIRRYISQETAFDRKIKERVEKEYEELKGRYDGSREVHDVQQGVSETKREDVGGR